MTRACRAIGLVVLVVGGMAGVGRGADPVDVAAVPTDRRPDNLLSFDTIRLFGDDIESVFTAPAGWDSADWTKFGVAGAAVVGTAAFDRRIRTSVQEHRSRGLDRFASHYRDLGAQYAFVVLAAFEGYGVTADSRNARSTFVDGLSASLIAGGLITPALKYVVGRARPGDSNSDFHFRPFTSAASFPSGHATEAFAVASVISAHYPETWVQVTAYGAAALVGAARVEQARHFASDVVAGALIGWSVGQAVVRHNDTPKKPAAVTVTPVASRSFTGLLISARF